MKRVLVVIAILVAAAACGGAATSTVGTSKPNSGTGVSNGGAADAGQPSKSTADGLRQLTARNPPASDSASRPGPGTPSGLDLPAGAWPPWPASKTQQKGWFAMPTGAANRVPALPPTVRAPAPSTPH